MHQTLAACFISPSQNQKHPKHNNFVPTPPHKNATQHSGSEPADLQALLDDVKEGHACTADYRGD